MISMFHLFAAPNFPYAVTSFFCPVSSRIFANLSHSLNQITSNYDKWDEEWPSSLECTLCTSWHAKKGLNITISKSNTEEV